MGRSARSAAGRAAGDFALRTLQEHLGDEWPRLAWEKHDQRSLPAELLLSSAHAVAFAQLVELALQLRTLPANGAGKIRKALHGDPRPQQIAHLRLQLELAALASDGGKSVALEVLLPGRTTPLDVLITDGEMIAIEALAVLLPQSHVDTQRYTDEVFGDLMSAHIRNDVGVTGHFNVQTPDATAAMLEGVTTAAVAVARDGVPRTIDDQAYCFEIDKSGRFEITGPSTALDPWTRAADRIRQKAVQAQQSGATWLRVDVLSGLWQAPQWASASLADKAATLARAVRQTLTDHPHMDAVVISSGRLHPVSGLTDEDAETTGAIAMRRVLEPLRVRDTILIPLRPQIDITPVADLYSSEPTWLARALSDARLPPPDETFAWSQP